MGKPLIMVSSITYAMKSKEILSRRGFKVYVERVPHTSEAVGCGYGVYVPPKNRCGTANFRKKRNSNFRKNGTG